MGKFSEEIRQISGMDSVKRNDELRMRWDKHEYTQKYIDRYFDAIIKNDICKSYFCDLKKKLSVKDVVGAKYKRVGRPNDGGYVMLDDFASANVIYSIGIAADVSWDSFFADNYDKDVYMYDHSIEGLPVEDKHFHWKKNGLSGVKDAEHPEFKTLTEMMEENGHSASENMILKMDIEGFEWDVFDKIEKTTLEKFDQIVLELHDLLDLNRREVILRALDKLNETHQLVHVHGNNGGYSINFEDIVIPNLLEATYVSRKKYEFTESNRMFPTPLDEKNILDFNEILLGFYC